MIAGFVITVIGMVIGYGLSSIEMNTLSYIVPALLTLFSIWFTHKRWSLFKLIIRVVGYIGLWYCYLVYRDSFVAVVIVSVSLFVFVMFAPDDDNWDRRMDASIARQQAKQREYEQELEAQRIDTERRRQEAKDAAIRQTGVHPSEVYVNSDGSKVNINGEWYDYHG